MAHVFGDTRKEAEKRARVIVAAREMHEALEAARLALLHLPRELDPEETDALYRIEDALRKARGKEVE